MAHGIGRVRSHARHRSRLRRRRQPQRFAARAPRGATGPGGSQVGPTWNNDNWTDLNTNLAITKPYFAASSAGPNPVVYAGAQDNGTDKYTGNAKWDQIFGGDGADVAVDPANPNNAYEEYVYLQMSSTKTGGSPPTTLRVTPT